MTTMWLVGAGAIAVAHAKVMTAIGVDFSVIGRGGKSADLFTSETGIPVALGGLEKALESEVPPRVAVLALPVNDLADAALLLIEAGTKRILIEKPGSLSIEVLTTISDAARRRGCLVSIAYNRRFYASTRELTRIVQADGGFTSVFFEFNEPKHLIQSDNYPQEVRQKWFLANSTHVVDLVFHLCGRPTDWQSWTSGELVGHSASSRFAGAGKLDSGALFSYVSDWAAPGRWGVEIMTVNHRLILRPMEKLHLMRHHSFEVQKVEIDDSLDIDFKPGFFRQMETFLSDQQVGLCSIEEHIKSMNFYLEIANYKAQE